MEILSKLWLTDNQIKIYICLLQLWSAWAGTISAKTGINRVSCYDNLDIMTSKWFVITNDKNGVRNFVAIHPDNLYDKQQKILSELENQIPLLKSFFDINPIKPYIYVWEWTDNIKRIYSDMLNYPNTIIKSFLWSEITNDNIKNFIDEDFEKIRIKKNILQKVINTKLTWEDKYEHTEQKSRLREKLSINNDKLNIKCWICIYWWDKIMINFFSHDDSTAVTIQNKLLHDSLESIWDMIWDGYVW